MMRPLLPHLVLLAAAACGPRSPAPASPATPPPSNRTEPADGSGAHVVQATLSRSACFGFCPVYTLTVFRDGTVEYNGEEWVKTRGKATWQLAPDVTAKIDDLFTRNGFTKLADAYTDYDMTDAPTARVSYAPAGGPEKNIEHYLGDSDAPPALEAVEEGLDKLVDIERRIGTQAEREQIWQNRR